MEQLPYYTLVPGEVTLYDSEVIRNTQDKKMNLTISSKKLSSILTVLV